MTLEEEIKIKKEEEWIWEELKIKKSKGYVANSIISNAQGNSFGSITLKQRDLILRRDAYKCIFCGATSSNDNLEVHHIIPRNIISKLHLNPLLQTESYNLITTCFNCNRGKSDNLAKEDIKLCLRRFANFEHCNHKITIYLKKIQELQEI